jgi:hypothetical protein
MPVPSRVRYSRCAKSTRRSEPPPFRSRDCRPERHPSLSGTTSGCRHHCRIGLGAEVVVEVFLDGIGIESVHAPRSTGSTGRTRGSACANDEASTLLRAWQTPSERVSTSADWQRLTETGQQVVRPTLRARAREDRAPPRPPKSERPGAAPRRFPPSPMVRLCPLETARTGGTPDTSPTEIVDPARF